MDEVESIMNDTFGLGEEDGIFRRMIGPYDTLKKSFMEDEKMGKKKIYITRNIPAHLIAPYENEFDISMWESETTPVPRDVLFQEAKQADGVICLLTEKMDAEFFQANDHLEIVANNAVGYDNVDIAAAQNME